MVTREPQRALQALWQRQQRRQVQGAPQLLGLKCCLEEAQQRAVRQGLFSHQPAFAVGLAAVALARTQAACLLLCITRDIVTR